MDAGLDTLYKQFGRCLLEAEVATMVVVAARVTNMVYDVCKKTGRFDTPLLESSPATTPASQKQKATDSMLLQSFQATSNDCMSLNQAGVADEEVSHRLLQEVWVPQTW